MTYLPRVVRLRLDEKEHSVAIYQAECVNGRCYLLAYMWRGEPRLAVVPAQASPLCVRARLSEDERRLVAEALAAAGLHLGYMVPLCLLPKRLLRESIEETIEEAIFYGIVKHVEP